jgi:hypothetical protein
MPVCEKGKVVKFCAKVIAWAGVSAAFVFLYNLYIPAFGWVTDTETGCQAWRGYRRLNETVSWSGPCKDGKANGQGVMKSSVAGQSPSRFEGHFVKGKLQGRGTRVWSNGSRYDGDFVDGERSGKGTMVWTNGSRYTGDFVDGERNGKGTTVWANGSRYTGDFVDGDRTGKGTFVWGQKTKWAGDRYEGDFINNKRTGKGMLVWTGGHRYEGDFVDGKRTGKGKYFWPDGDHYEGAFIDDKRTGKGIYVWADEIREKDAFTDVDVTSVRDKGSRYDGGDIGRRKTNKAKLIGQNFLSGITIKTRYQGDFVDGKRTGKGTFFGDLIPDRRAISTRGTSSREKEREKESISGPMATLTTATSSKA